MARQAKENVDYFPFFCKEGKGMSYIKRKYGVEGYCVWVQLLRMLSITNNHWLNLSNPIELMFLSTECMVEETKIVKILDDLAILGEIDKTLWIENRIVWNQKFINNIEEAYKKRNNKCWSYEQLLDNLNSLGIRKSNKSILKGSDNPQIKENKIREKEIREDKRKVIELSSNYVETIEQKQENEFWPTFNDFWNEYDKRVGNKEKVAKKWNKINLDDRINIMSYILKYKESQPDKKFRKNPETFLNNKSWLDEIIYTKESISNTSDDFKRKNMEIILGEDE